MNRVITSTPKRWLADADLEKAALKGIARSAHQVARTNSMEFEEPAIRVVLADVQAEYNSGSITLRHAGRLHHIGVGRTHARTHIILIARDLDIRIVNAATGELL